MYQILPHTADIRILVRSQSLEGLFRESLKSLADILKSSRKSKKNISQKLRLSSYDESALLIDFLSDVLTESYNQKAVFEDVVFNVFKNDYLEAEVFGEAVENFDEDIKAVTYHEAKIKKNELGEFEIIITCDI